MNRFDTIQLSSPFRRLQTALPGFPLAIVAVHAVWATVTYSTNLAL